MNEFIYACQITYKKLHPKPKHRNNWKESIEKEMWKIVHIDISATTRIKDANKLAHTSNLHQQVIIAWSQAKILKAHAFSSFSSFSFAEFLASDVNWLQFASSFGPIYFFHCLSFIVLRHSLCDKRHTMIVMFESLFVDGNLKPWTREKINESQNNQKNGLPTYLAEVEGTKQKEKEILRLERRGKCEGGAVTRNRNK